MQGLQLVGLQEVACSSPGWRLSSLQDTQPGDSMSPALTSSITASMELPANSQSTLVCQMYPPQPAAATHPAGLRVKSCEIELRSNTMMSCCCKLTSCWSANRFFTQISGACKQFCPLHSRIFDGSAQRACLAQV